MPDPTGFFINPTSIIENALDPDFQTTLNLLKDAVPTRVVGEQLKKSKPDGATFDSRLEDQYIDVGKVLQPDQDEEFIESRPSSVIPTPIEIIKTVVDLKQVEALPKFAEGTRGEPFTGGPAVVGEIGPEKIVTSSGEVYTTPAQATIVNLPPGSQVMPAASAEKPKQIYEITGSIEKLSGKLVPDSGEAAAPSKESTAEEGYYQVRLAGRDEKGEKIRRTTQRDPDPEVAYARAIESVKNNWQESMPAPVSIPDIKSLAGFKEVEATIVSNNPAIPPTQEKEGPIQYKAAGEIQTATIPFTDENGKSIGDKTTYTVVFSLLDDSGKTVNRANYIDFDLNKAYKNAVKSAKENFSMVTKDFDLPKLKELTSLDQKAAAAETAPANSPTEVLGAESKKAETPAGKSEPEKAGGFFDKLFGKKEESAAVEEAKVTAKSEALPSAKESAETVSEKTEPVNTAFANTKKSQPEKIEPAKEATPTPAESVSAEKPNSNLSDEEFSKLMSIYRAKDPEALKAYESELAAKLKGSNKSKVEQSISQTFAASPAPSAAVSGQQPKKAEPEQESVNQTFAKSTEPGAPASEKTQSAQAPNVEQSIIQTFAKSTEPGAPASEKTQSAQAPKVEQSTSQTFAASPAPSAAVSGQQRKSAELKVSTPGQNRTLELAQALTGPAKTSPLPATSADKTAESQTEGKKAAEPSKTATPGESIATEFANASEGEEDAALDAYLSRDFNESDLASLSSSSKPITQDFFVKSAPSEAVSQPLPPLESGNPAEGSVLLSPSAASSPPETKVSQENPPMPAAKKTELVESKPESTKTESPKPAAQASATQGNESISNSFAAAKSNPIAAESGASVTPSAAVSAPAGKAKPPGESSSLSDDEFSNLVGLYKGSDKVKFAEYEAELAGKLRGSSPAMPSESVAASFAKPENAKAPEESIAGSFTKKEESSSPKSESISSEFASTKKAEPTPSSTVATQSNPVRPAAEVASSVSNSKPAAINELSKKAEPTPSSTVATQSNPVRPAAEPTPSSTVATQSNPVRPAAEPTQSSTVATQSNPVRPAAEPTQSSTVATPSSTVATQSNPVRPAAEPTQSSTVATQSNPVRPAAEVASSVSNSKPAAINELSKKAEQITAPAKPAEIIEKEKAESAKNESSKPGFFGKIKSLFSGSDKNEGKNEKTPTLAEPSKKTNLGEKFFGDKVGNTGREVLAKEFGLTAEEKARVDAGLPSYPEESEEDEESVSGSPNEPNVSNVLNATAEYPKKPSEESSIPSISDVINGKAVATVPEESSVESSPMLLLPEEKPVEVEASAEEGSAVSVKTSGALSENAKNTLINPPNPIIPAIKNLSSTVESSSASMASTVAETVSSAMTASSAQGSSQNTYNTVNNNSTGVMNQGAGQSQPAQPAQPEESAKPEQQPVNSDYYMRLLYEAIVTHGIKLRNI